MTVFKAPESLHYNLAAGRYKPQVAEAVSDDDPTELIKEVLGIERWIALGLEQLLEEIG